MRTRLKSNLPRIANATDGAASRALLKTGADVLDVAKQLVPVDTSSLKTSGGVVPESSNLVVVGFGGPGVYFDGREPEQYAIPVEYGSSRSPAQPFLRPAFQQATPTYKVNLIDEMKKIT